MLHSVFCYVWSTSKPVFPSTLTAPFFSAYLNYYISLHLFFSSSVKFPTLIFWSLLVNWLFLTFVHLSPYGRNLKVLSLEYRTAKNLMSISFPVHPLSSTKLHSVRLGCFLLPSQAQCLLLSFSTSLLGDIHMHLKISVDLAMNSLLKPPSSLEILFLLCLQFQSPHLLLVQHFPSVSV